MTSAIPHTAAPTWSGYIYQGYIATYHSIQCLLQNMDFELQLDSIEDFSIIKDGEAISTHQVKARDENKRSEYIDALEKAASVDKLCTKRTKRYFHTSIKLDNHTDFTGKSGNIVSFYLYGKDPFCHVHDAEKKIKEKIREYLAHINEQVSDQLVELKFESLQCRILAQVLYIHAATQDGLMTAKEAAYLQTIKSSAIQKILSATAEFDDDVKYKTFKARNSFTSAFKKYAEKLSKSAEASDYQRVIETFGQIKELDDFQFRKILKSVCIGSGSEKISDPTVYDYIDIIRSISKNPTREDIPYYLCKHKKFYLPTAISAPNTDREELFAETLLEQIKSDPAIFDILVEYDWLIADSASTFSPLERFCSAQGASKDKVEDEYRSIVNAPHRITRAFEAKIISKVEAKERIDD